MIRWTLALMLTTGLLAQTVPPGAGSPVTLTPPVTQIVLIRNAEYVTGGKAPELSGEGRTRAKQWALCLPLYGPKALYATTGPITRATLGPTAEQLKLTPKGYDPKDLKGLAKEILGDHEGETVVVCWPAKYLKPLALALGVPEPLAEWPSDLAQQIWVIRLDAEGAGAIDTGTQSAPPDPGSPGGNAALWGIKR